MGERSMYLLKKLKEWVLDRPRLPGKTIKGRYQIVEYLGMGSFGMTYLILDQETKKKIVLKQVKPSRMGTPFGKPSYDYEVAIMQKINHPHMPVLFDAFTERKKLYLVMSYMQGITLEDVIFTENKTFTEKEAFQVIAQLIPLIKYLHQKKIIHRDIRLPNVLEYQGKYYLIDFGLARFLGSPLPREGEVPLSEGRQIRREIHVHSDLYALGHLLLFLLYTTYNDTEDKEEKSWEEELTLSNKGKGIIRRLLQLDHPYDDVEQARLAIEDYLNTPI
ncbi:MAG TPA: serine/threonine protein kinase [Paenibacillaceae bacterium]|nr:serine/threonine protein kinase [Paenibacillaceae bacterium]